MLRGRRIARCERISQNKFWLPGLMVSGRESVERPSSAKRQSSEAVEKVVYVYVCVCVRGFRTGGMRGSERSARVQLSNAMSSSHQFNITTTTSYHPSRLHVSVESQSSICPALLLFCPRCRCRRYRAYIASRNHDDTIWLDHFDDLSDMKTSSRALKNCTVCGNLSI